MSQKIAFPSGYIIPPQPHPEFLEILEKTLGANYPGGISLRNMEILYVQWANNPENETEEAVHKLGQTLRFLDWCKLWWKLHEREAFDNLIINFQ